MNFQEQTVVIIGGSSDTGLAHEAGAFVVISKRYKDRLERAESEIGDRVIGDTA